MSGQAFTWIGFDLASEFSYETIEMLKSRARSVHGIHAEVCYGASNEPPHVPREP